MDQNHPDGFDYILLRSDAMKRHKRLFKFIVHEMVHAYITMHGHQAEAHGKLSQKYVRECLCQLNSSSSEMLKEVADVIF